MKISPAILTRYFVDRFWRLKNKVFLRLSWAISNFSVAILSRGLIHAKDMRKALFEVILTCNPAIASLNKENNYFLLHASYGDKWLILSFLAEHFKFYPNSFVIACHQDRGLIEIFLGPSITADRFIFIDQEPLNNLSSFFRPVSMISMPLADIWYTEGCKMVVTSFFLSRGLPPGSIRHLHLVYYPYFNEFYCLHGVSYGTLLKVILYLPAFAKSRLPTYYSEQDYQAARAISSSSSLSAASPLLPAVLINVVNISNASLSIAQISLLISILEAHGYRVLLNVTQSASSEKLASLVASHHSEAVLVTVPAILLALVCDNVHAVIGVLGGAMGVACQFSGAHLLSFQTSAMFTGCPEDELFGEWGKDKFWESVDQDWPCLHPGRVVENKFIGDPESLGDAELVDALKPFLEKIGSVGLAT